MLAASGRELVETVREDVLDILARTGACDIGTIYRTVIARHGNLAVPAVGELLARLIREHAIEVETHVASEHGPLIGIARLTASPPPRHAGMRVETIPRKSWRSFLEGFAAQHRDWIAHLSRVERGDVDVSDAHAVPLREIRVEERAGAPTSVTVLAGTVTHTLFAPRKVRVYRREDGADVSLEVQGAGGSRLWLEFPVTQPAEAVDGYFDGRGART